MTNEEAIEWIKALRATDAMSNNTTCLLQRKEALNKAIKALEEQQQNRWIPVSKRLPEDRREVLVTAYWHETYQVMGGCYFGDGIWWCVPYNNCGTHMQKLNPIAWMPLPEPYEEVN